MNLSRIPEHMRQAVTDYVENGIPPGGFLRAVLANNLVEAFGRADDINSMHMEDWANLVHWELPSDCHGSEAIVDAWLARHFEARVKAVPNDK